jgi:ligand-binding sensor domain-containing protein/signal transduction histidine kinase
MNEINHLRLLRGMSGIMLFMLLVLCNLTILAQRYPFHNLSVDDGLIQSQATSMAQDKTGNLWIGTFGGLSRYDGHSFTNYTIRNGLPSNTIWSVGVDSDGNIWAGEAAAISRFDGKTFTHFDRPQQQAPHLLNYTQQIQAGKDTVWWRVAGDLYFIAAGKINYYTTPGPPGFVSAILLEKEGLWVAKDGILYYLANKKADTIRYTVAGEYPTFNIFKIYRDKDRVIWLATNIGLCRLDKKQILQKGIGADTATTLPVVSSITQDKNGSLWLGTGKGVIRVSGKTVQYYNKHNGLSDNTFFEVFTDFEGNVWMASDGQGLFRYSGTQFTGLDETMGLPSAQIMAIASNRQDALFLGTYDAGLYVFKDGKVSPFPFPSSPVPAITSLCYTHKSKLWIGTRGRGLWSYENAIFRQYSAPERHFPSNLIYCLYEDAERRLWIGFQNGAMVLRNDSFKTVISKSTGVSSFLSIGKDSVLIATDNGLYIHVGDTVQPFRTNTQADSFRAKCFVMQGRNLWMGSSDYGIIRYNLDTRSVLVINKGNGLRSDFIYNLVTDNDGNVWAGTGFGIHKIRMNKDEPHVTFYGKAQGITGMESNINAVLKMPDGSIWFGTTNGAMHYQPHAAEMSSAPVSIVLQSVKLAGGNVIEPGYYDSTDNWYRVPYHLHLPYKLNNITFTFQAIALSGQQVLYRYRMEGLEAPWSDWSATNSVSYSALPPGNYVFRVQCQGAEAQNEPELAYAFEIITPFQKTGWFRLAVLIACILLGILLQYIVNNRKQRRERLLAKLRSEEQAKIRLRTAEDFHDEIGNKLTRINVLTNVLKNKVTLNPETLRILGQIEDNTAQLYGGTRDILWSLKPSNDSLYEILHRIRDFGGELFQDTEVDFAFTGTDEKWRNFKLPMDMSRNLIMIFKEALNNSLKYAHAKNVSLDVQLKNKNVLHMVLKDDGQGFDVHSVKKGNGISNMQIRAGRLNGRLYVDSRINKGTLINLSFKLPTTPKGKYR